MTNEEVIDCLKDVKIRLCNRLKSKEDLSIDIAINSIQENTKFKAEINRLIGKSGMYRDMADSFCESNKKLKAEIEQLKWISYENLKTENDVHNRLIKEKEAEIEQWQSTNLKLTCELTRVECENYQLKAELEQSVKLPYPIDTPIYFAYSKQGVVKDKIRRWQINNKGLMFYSKGSAFLPDTIGKSIFLTREEAEQSLKGKVEE